MANAISTRFTIDTRQLKKLARDLEETTPGISKELTTSIREGAAVTAVAAKALSSWSSRIPGSIRVLGSNQRVVVRAGGKNAPHAGPYENHGTPGDFRHPVFGNRDVWVSQRARPFLTPALQVTAPILEKRVEIGVAKVFAEHGFH